jgi:hypothetical protein
VAGSDLERILHLADPEAEFTDVFKAKIMASLHIATCTVADFLKHYLNVLVVPCNGEELLTDPGDH